MTVCVLSYNHPEITARAVKSALAFGPVLLVHNGSHSKNVNQLEAQFPQVAHLKIENNKGYSGGLNEGLGAAFNASPWVLFLSNDCELLSPPTLPLEPGLIAPIIYRRKIGMVDSAGGGFNPNKAKLVHFRSPSEFETAHLNGWLQYLPGSSFLVHKNVFEDVGLMDSGLGTYWDDVDWSMRARERGYKIEIGKGFQVLHRVGKTCHKNPLYSIYYYQRNRKKISWKYCPSYLKPKLSAHLTWDWLKLSKKLIQSGRFRDLRYLKNAAFD